MRTGGFEEAKKVLKLFLIWYCSQEVSIGDILVMTDLVNSFLEAYY